MSPLSLITSQLAVLSPTIFALLATIIAVTTLAVFVGLCIAAVVGPSPGWGRRAERILRLVIDMIRRP